MRTRLKTMITLLGAVAFLIGPLGSGDTFPFYYDEFQSTYPDYSLPTGTECRICHKNPNGSGPRNPYGVDILAADFDFVSIESLDSDGDMLANGNEISLSMPPGRAPVLLIANALIDAVPPIPDPDQNADTDGRSSAFIFDAADVVGAYLREKEEAAIAP